VKVEWGCDYDGHNGFTTQVLVQQVTPFTLLPFAHVLGAPQAMRVAGASALTGHAFLLLLLLMLVSMSLLSLLPSLQTGCRLRRPFDGPTG